MAGKPARGIEPDGGEVLERPPSRALFAPLRRVGVEKRAPLAQVDPRDEPVPRGAVEVHLADGRGGVPPVAQPVAERDGVVGEGRREERHADGVGQKPGENRLPAGRADRSVAEGTVEPNSLPRQWIEPGRGLARVAVDAECPPGMVVADQDQRVRSRGAGWVGPLGADRLGPASGRTRTTRAISQTQTGARTRRARCPRPPTWPFTGVVFVPRVECETWVRIWRNFALLVVLQD
jgi:hypothetical protein